MEEAKSGYLWEYRMIEKRYIFTAISTAVITTLILTGFIAPVRAQEPAPASQPSTQQEVPLPPTEFSAPAAKKVPAGVVPELVIAGKVVMRLRSNAGGMTAQERAYNLSQRIGPILTLPNLSGDDVQVHQLHPGFTASIYVRDRLLVTVDRNLAAANKTTVDSLARAWAKNLRATLPKINVAVRLSGATSSTASSSVP